MNEFRVFRVLLLFALFQVIIILHKGTLQGNKNISKINYKSSKKKMCAVTKVAYAFELVTATDKLVSINMYIIKISRNRVYQVKYR